MTHKEAIKKLGSAHNNLNLLLLRLDRMQREVAKLERELSSEETNCITTLVEQIEHCVRISPLPKKSGLEDLGWGPI